MVGPARPMRAPAADRTTIRHALPALWQRPTPSHFQERSPAWTSNDATQENPGLHCPRPPEYVSEFDVYKASRKSRDKHPVLRPPSREYLCLLTLPSREKQIAASESHGALLHIFPQSNEANGYYDIYEIVLLVGCNSVATRRTWQHLNLAQEWTTKKIAWRLPWFLLLGGRCSRSFTRCGRTSLKRLSLETSFVCGLGGFRLPW